MERPLCPLCKAKHFAREAHAFKVICEVPSAIETVPKLFSSKDVSRETIPKGRFDRTVYQREYMRKYRKRITNGG